MIDAPDAQVQAPELALFTLVRNVVDNAIRYTPEGGVVDLRLHADARQVVLEVEDNGPGIPADERDACSTRSTACWATSNQVRDWGCPSSRPGAAAGRPQLELRDASHYPHGLNVRLTLAPGAAPQP